MSGAGDLSVLEGALDPEAKWRGVGDTNPAGTGRALAPQPLTRRRGSGMDLGAHTMPA